MMGNQETFPSTFTVDLGEEAEDYMDEDGIMSLITGFVKRALTGGGIGYFLVMLLCIIYFVCRVVQTLLGSTLGVILQVLAAACCSKKMKVDGG